MPPLARTLPHPDRMPSPVRLLRRAVELMTGRAERRNAVIRIDPETAPLWLLRDLGIRDGRATPADLRGRSGR
jgi:hypothetical protein